MSAKDNKKLTKIQTELTSRRFCTAHQGLANEQGGMIKETSGAPRWICGDCIARAKSASGQPFLTKTAVTEIEPIPREAMYRPAYKMPTLLVRDGADDYKQWPSKGGD